MKIKSLFDAASEVDGTNAKFEEVLYALQVLDEALENEGMIPDDKRNTMHAVCFMDRFPMFFATYRVLCRELAQISRELQEAADEMYKMWRGGRRKLPLTPRPTIIIRRTIKNV